MAQVIVIALLAAMVVIGLAVDSRSKRTMS
jgi:hypothetical protein